VALTGVARELERVTLEMHGAGAALAKAATEAGPVQDEVVA
jgi:hypothetical protein